MHRLELLIAFAILATTASMAVAISRDGDARARAILFAIVGFAGAATAVRALFGRRSRRHAIAEAIDREFRAFEEL